MFELNDQELEQVAGGFHIGTGSGANGGGSTDYGTITSLSLATSKATPTQVTSSAGNLTTGKGTNVVVVSSAGAGASADDK